MASSRYGRGVALLTEGLVILVSILAAFMLEGWRADRELNRDLVQELTSVQRELERNRDLVSSQIASLSRVVSGTRGLLTLLDSSPGSSMVPVVDTLVFLSTGYSPSLDPSLGALDALITSGRLSQIRDPELRLKLAGVRYLLLDAMEEESVARKVLLEHIFPLVRDDLDLGVTERVATEFFGSREASGVTTQERAAGRSLPSYRTVGYPNSNAIRSTIAMQTTWLETGIDEYAQVLEYIGDLMQRLAQELDHRQPDLLSNTELLLSG
ncbi:MAG: hypothetical protein O2958_09630 [Gemmatimonadetes bacterium]|nr:hypothetical protein [Gemmatimonadota bacterium]MDA1103326.1 hypothetical protein [Gemmatimonadota bacterium]